jgi:adenylate kinase
MLLAPPGAGKGTQGVRLAEHFGVTHIAAGDLLREEINGQSERGRRARAYVDRGELVPDQVVIDLVTPAAVAAAAAGGFVLDGFPRTTPRRGILLSVDGNQSVEAVTDAIVGELAKMADTAPER